VSWIDPNFGYPFHGRYENDDHPPADIMAGQELVSKVFHAVSQGPPWNETLLVIVYDEHGGFCDHQHPSVTPEDDDPDFREYGARVPASSSRRGPSRAMSRRTATTTQRSSRQSSFGSAAKTIRSRTWVRG